VMSLVVGVLLVGVGVFSFVIGVVITASGHFNPGVGVAIALPVLVVIAALAGRGYRPGPGVESEEAPIPGLLWKINGVLDSTSAFPG
jgi:hypothetical protein